MSKIQNLMVALRDGEDGQGMVEYAVILAMVSLAAIAVLPPLGTAILNTFTDANNTLNSTP